MGEVVEMMEEGLLCECCGVYLENSKGEFFHACAACAEDDE